MAASFLLITPAGNEENFIQHSLDAVVSPKLNPTCRAIDSDNSTDGTDRIVQWNRRLLLEAFSGLRGAVGSDTKRRKTRPVAARSAACRSIPHPMAGVGG